MVCIPYDDIFLRYPSSTSSASTFTAASANAMHFPPASSICLTSQFCFYIRIRIVVAMPLLLPSPSSPLTVFHHSRQNLNNVKNVLLFLLFQLFLHSCGTLGICGITLNGIFSKEPKQTIIHSKPTSQPNDQPSDRPANISDHAATFHLCFVPFALLISGTTGLCEVVVFLFESAKSKKLFHGIVFSC